MYFFINYMSLDNLGKKKAHITGISPFLNKEELLIFQS